MNRVFLCYQNDERKVFARIEQLSSDNNSSSYTIGSISLLKSTQKLLQQRLLSMHFSLKSYSTLPNIEFRPSIPSESAPNDDEGISSESCPDETSTDDSDQELLLT